MPPQHVCLTTCTSAAGACGRPRRPRKAPRGGGGRGGAPASSKRGLGCSRRTLPGRRGRLPEIPPCAHRLAQQELVIVGDDVPPKHANLLVPESGIEPSGGMIER